MGEPTSGLRALVVVLCTLTLATCGQANGPGAGGTPANDASGETSPHDTATGATDTSTPDAVAGDTHASDTHASDTHHAPQPDALQPDAPQPDAPQPDTPTTCLTKGWQGYFDARPAVAAATLGRLSPEGLSQLCAHLAELDSVGKLSVAQPKAAASCVEPAYCPTIAPTQAELLTIQSAKYAHALWIDRNAKVPWKLDKLSPAQLDELFDPALLLSGGVLFKYVVDHSPSEVYGYMVDQGLIKATMLETLVAVVADLRTTDTEIDFIHGLKSHPTNTAVTVHDALTTFVNPRVSRRGCHSMTRIVLAMLRSVNVPGREVNAGQWTTNLHSSAQWSVVGRVLAHGDDIYNAALRAAPSAELLTPMSFFSDPGHVAHCGSNKACLAWRHVALVATAHPPHYYATRCCEPAKWKVESCEAFLETSFGSYLSAAELATMVTAMKGTCGG